MTIDIVERGYAVVDGAQYEAKLNREAVSIFIPQIGEPSDGWAWAVPDQRYRAVEADDVPVVAPATAATVPVV